MRAKYDRNFKIELCKDIEDGNLKVGEASKQYNIQRTTVSRWVAEYKKYQNNAFSGNGNKLHNDAELEYLKQENRRLKMELDILKKFDEFVKNQK